MTEQLVSITPSGRGNNSASKVLTRATRPEEKFWQHLSSINLKVKGLKTK